VVGLQRKSSVLLRVLVKICYRKIMSVAIKYNSQCLDVSVLQIMNCIWKSFAGTVIPSCFLFAYCVF